MGSNRKASFEGKTAAEIAAHIEVSIRQGRLPPGESLPTVRRLAIELQVSPATVAAAYRVLRGRGLLVTAGRRGTAVSPHSPLAQRGLAPVPAGVRDLVSGNPDPALLPDWSEALASLRATQVLYGDEHYDRELLRLAAERFEQHGVPARHLAVVAGALDGIERVLASYLRPGDRVAVEDPCFTGVLYLLGALGLVPVPVAIDDHGPLPDALGGALRAGVDAFIVTPRAQNPTGAALDDSRASELRRILSRHSGVLMIEDDHAGSASGAPAISLAGAGLARWASVHSVSKTLGPDLRLAVMSCDAETLERVEGRQLLGIRWVSHVLQRLVVALWQDAEVTRLIQHAGAVYAERRAALIEALAGCGIAAHGRSGLHVWVPVPEEASALGVLLEAGYAVAAGERHRLVSAPALRVTIASLETNEATAVAEAFAAALHPNRSTGATDWV